MLILHCNCKDDTRPVFSFITGQLLPQTKYAAGILFQVHCTTVIGSTSRGLFWLAMKQLLHHGYRAPPQITTPKRNINTRY